MQKINLLSALILFGAFQGIVLSIALNKIKNRNRLANRLLAIFILLISSVLLSRLVYIEGVSIVREFPRLYLIPDIPMFIYGPLFYLYVRSLLHNETLKFKEIWPHFIPAVVHISIMSLYLFESREEYIRRLMQNDLIELPWSPFAAIVQSAVYIIFSYLIYQRYLNRIKDNVSYNFPIKYLQTIFLVIALCWFAWLVSALGSTVQSLLGLGFINYNIAWVALSFTTFSLAYFAIVQPDIFRLEPASAKYKKSSLTHDEIDILQETLTGFMKSHKPYLNPGLTISDLSELINIPQRDLSRLVNEGFGKNFFDFVNLFRVEEFKELARMDKYRNMTVLAIAFDAGFNSKTTFNTSFKKHIGITPSEFITQIKNQPDYELN